MNTEFGELAQAQYRARNGRRRIYIVIGLLLIVAGYFLMAVSPGTSSDWVLARAMGGLACIVVGFGMAILPLLAHWSGGD
jgi:hypothetical protein